jgi:hypothetical protein
MLPHQVLAEAHIEGRTIAIALAPQGLSSVNPSTVYFLGKLDLTNDMPDGYLHRIRFHGCDGLLVTAITMQGRNLLLGPATEPSLIERIKFNEPWRKIVDLHVTLKHRSALQ